ncbi:MAG: PKD domain-containing protein [Saprospiraceae bacterium]
MKIPLPLFFITFGPLVLFFLSFSSLFAQDKGDHIWLFGYARFIDTNPIFGSCYMDFNELPVTVGAGYWGVDFDMTDASICNQDGELQLYTNGNSIINGQHEILENGDGLNPNGTLGFNEGLSLIQGAVVLPRPENESAYFILHEGFFIVQLPSTPVITCNPFYYSEVDLSANNGLGAVVKKNEILINDTLDGGKIVATRHANGRDWWAVVPQYGTNGFYRILVDPEGVHNMGVQEVGVPMVDGLGQAQFSPDGSKYVHLSLKHFTVNYLNIYDFDRCTGELSNHVQYFFDSNIGAGGVAISPNSRFLYLIEPQRIFQFDLWASDIISTKTEVAVYDGYEEAIPLSTDTLLAPVQFFLGQLAPDGKIYINVPFITVRAMTVIEYPDKKGLGCQVRQHSFHLPTLNQFSMPNFPNYRLGPLDGSPCDTLGIDNTPMAKFRYEQDTLDFLQVEFTDLSYYEPAEWSWDFGDNTTSQDTSPVHIFPQGGTYEVCLTVSNVNGEHTFCRTLELGTVSTAEEAELVTITVFPNPCRDGVNFILSDYLPRDAKVVLYDAVGQLLKTQSVQTGWNTVRLDGLPTGIYFYEIWEREVRLDRGKLMKVE